MKTKTATRRAMLLSLTALLICAAMLVGTTFAWFTDSVTSGNNRIIAGNLDVELYHKTTGTTAADPGDSVNGETMLFNASTDTQKKLWEPGAMAYETFTVKNVGTLSLKYKMSVIKAGNNFVMDTNDSNTGRSLLDVLRVAVIDGAPTAALTREGIKTQVGTNWTTLKDFTAVNADDIVLGPKDSVDTLNNPLDSKTFTVAIYWPSDTESITALSGGLKDNDYNLQNGKYASDATAATVGELWVDLGVSLLATQYGSDFDTDPIAESDSFGKDYDVLAENAAPTSATAQTEVSGDSSATVTAFAAPANDAGAVTTATFTGLNQGGNPVTTGNVTLNVETSNVLAAESAYTALNDEDPVAVISLSLNDDSGDDVSFATAVITTYITQGLSNPTLQWTDGTNSETWTTNAANEAAVTGHTAYYDAASGKLVFETTHFSDYVVYDNVNTYNYTQDKVYAGLQTAIDGAGSGDTLMLLKDIAYGTQTATPVIVAEDDVIVLDLNGHVVSASVNDAPRVLVNRGTLTVKDTSSAKTGAISNVSTGNNDCTRTIQNAAGATLTVESGSILSSNGQALFNQGDCTLKSGALVKTTSAYSGNYSNGAVAIDIRGGATLNIFGAAVYAQNGLAIFAYGSPAPVVTITDGDFTCKPEQGLFGGSGATAIAATGGTYNYDPSMFTAQGYGVAQSGGKYIIGALQQTHDFDVSSEEELLSALASAGSLNPVQVTLSQNVTLTHRAELISGSSVIVPQGKKLTVADNGVFVNNGTLTNNGEVAVTGTGFLTNPLNVVGTGALTGYTAPVGEDKDYTISKPMDLQWIAVFNSGEMIDDLNVTLANDVVMPSDVAFQPIPVFGGVFNGNGHTISNLTIDSASDYTGIFVCLAGATIKNITLDVSVTALSGTTGGVAGYINDAVYFENVTLNGSVTVYGTTYGTAGFVGNVYGTESGTPLHFVDCVNNATINAANGSIAGAFYGTATGNHSPLYVIDCTNNGDVTCGGYAASVGGFMSYQSTGRTYVYGHNNTGTITSDGSVVNTVLGADGYGTVYDATQYDCTPGENGAFVITHK